MEGNLLTLSSMTSKVTFEGSNLWIRNKHVYNDCPVFTVIMCPLSNLENVERVILSRPREITRPGWSLFHVCCVNITVYCPPSTGLCVHTPPMYEQILRWWNRSLANELPALCRFKEQSDFVWLSNRGLLPAVIVLKSQYISQSQ